MKLTKLLKGINYQLISGNLDIDITDLTYDSRSCKPNMAFVALIGIDTNGHNYINDVINQGCTCIITCQDIESLPTNITIIKVSDTRKELAYLSANLFQHPSKELIKIAITGTKGKTSTAWMIKEILEQAGHKVGVIGTIGTYINGKIYHHKNTTPESYHIQKFLRQMVDCQTKYLIMEASSQALKVGRISNIHYEYAIFTNLSNDHIGPREHPSFEDYKYSKSVLFNQAEIGILNADDAEYPYFLNHATCKTYTYGTNNSDLIITNINPHQEPGFIGTKFTTTGLINHNFLVNAPGNFSAYNASAAILLAQLLNIPTPQIKTGLKNFQVAGRCEMFNINNKFTVVIDFAHNKISMESIIQTMRQYHPNRIITIFGCGGGRSTSIRYELGTISGALSDLSIITTDNPRQDDIDLINEDIKQGIISQKGQYLIIKDRKEAIEFALNQAQPNDIILLLGKGHETYQEIKNNKFYFNEREIITNYLNKTN